jgi:hypothetical protein
MEYMSFYPTGFSNPYPVNYKYLRTRKWYRIFRILVILVELLIILWNLNHANNFWGQIGFSWQAFLSGSVVMISLTQLVKYGVVRIVEGERMYTRSMKK